MRKLVLSVCLFLFACQVGPDYHKPSVNLPDKWGNAPPNNQKKQATLQEIYWWKNFKDPTLIHLAKETVAANYDLKIALTKICEMKANLLGAEASIAPEIDATGSFSHNQNSINTPRFSTQQGGPIGGSSLANRDFNLYRTGFTTNWEIDLFGRIRRNIEAAEAMVEAKNEDMHNILLSLIAEVAFNYINLRSYQEQLNITQRFYESFDKIYNLNQELMQSGLATEIDVLQARILRDQAHASYVSLAANIKTTMHTLAILTGKAPLSLYKLLRIPKPIPSLSSEIFAGLPSDLLKRRPDIRQAERNLAASTAQIGVAEGSFFPVFSLTGTIGYQSNLGSNLFSSLSGFYSFGPGFTWPIADFGRVRAMVCAAMAVRDQKLDEYYNTVLKALADVENALVNYDAEAKRYHDLKTAYEASKIAVEISLARFEAGLINFITVLQAEVTFYTMALALTKSQATISSNSVFLYKALGGGWQQAQKPCHNPCHNSFSQCTINLKSGVSHTKHNM